MSGLIGGLLKDHLISIGGYQLSALNRSFVEGVSTHSADIAELDQIRPAFENIDVVVHLAAYLGSDSFEKQLPANIIGTYNVFEAARSAGVKRVVYASSASTVRGVEHIYPYGEIAQGNYENVKGPIPLITHQDIRPGGVYGATKIWGGGFGATLFRYLRYVYAVRSNRFSYKGQYSFRCPSKIHISKP